MPKIESRAIQQDFRLYSFDWLVTSDIYYSVYNACLYHAMRIIKVDFM